MLWKEWRIVDAVQGRRWMLPCSFWFLLLFAAGGLVLFIHLQDLSDMVQQQAPAPRCFRYGMYQCTRKDSYWKISQQIKHKNSQIGPNERLEQITGLSSIDEFSDRVRDQCAPGAKGDRNPGQNSGADYNVFQQLGYYVPGMKPGGTPQSRETLGTQDGEGARSDPHQDQGLAVGGLASPIPPMQFPDFERNRQTATPGSREQDMGSLRITKRHRKLLKTSPMIHSNNASSSSSPSSTSVSVTSESRGHLSHIQEARQRLMKEMCAKYKSSISRTVTPHHVSHIYVEDRYKLLYCEVPKAGCSNWKRTLMVLSGEASNAQSINHDTAHYANHLKRLDSFDQQGIMHRLDTYTKLLFVREPLERLVSAYRDKFESPNSYYHPMFGKPIISKYRVNPSKAALSTGNGVTFHEFVQYLLDIHRPVGMDVHWEPANQLCNPCLLDYSFIGKFENMEEESNFLLRRTGAPRNVMLPSFKDRNPKEERTSTHLMQKYFAQAYCEA